MTEKLSELENVGVGSVASFVQAVIMQPTLYWKNAAQQGLPFTVNPRVVYRGIGASLVNECGQMGLQFGTTGYLKKMFGTDMTGEMASAILGGVIVGPFASVCECTMIQQQRFGGSLIETPARIVRQFGVSGLLRGCTATLWRDGLYVGGLLGTTPRIQAYLSNEHGCSQLTSEIGAGVVSGTVVGTLSTPMDAVSTVMKGDLEKAKYVGFMSTLRARANGGMSVLFGGAFWRSVNIVGTIVIANAVRVRLEPYVIELSEQRSARRPS